MKRFFFLAVLISLLASACNDAFVEQDRVQLPQTEQLPDLTAGFADDVTRTYVEDNKYLRWHENDLITAFYGNTLNRLYKFNGETGDNNGTFSLVSTGELGTGNALDAIYAIYPYDSSATITDQGVMTLSLPAYQDYAENSFGDSANTMVAVTQNVEDTFLPFKNVCGYLKLYLYNGEAAQMKSVELTGNNGELIAGKATVVVDSAGEPVLTMDSKEATTSVTVQSADGVYVGRTAQTATEVWFVLPEITFEKGFTVQVKDIHGRIFEKSTANRVAIERNAIQPMEPLALEYKPLETSEYVLRYTSTEQLVPKNLDVEILVHNYNAETSEGEIYFKERLTMLEDDTFSNLRDSECVTSIELPEGLTHIGDYVFYYTENLARISLPSTLVSIGYQVFRGTNITRVDVADLRAYFEIDLADSYASPPTTGTLFYVNGEELKELYIPDGIKKIGYSLFGGCYSLTKIVVPNSVTHIGDYAFSHCSNVKEIHIGESVEYIGANAFYYCDANIYCYGPFPATLKKTIISDGSFYEPYSYWGNFGSCKIIVPLAYLDSYKDSWSMYAASIYPDYTPEVTDNNTIIYFPTDHQAVTLDPGASFGANIVAHTFENGYGKIVFDGPVTEIGLNAFNGTNVKDVMLPESVELIAINAFANSKLDSINIPASVKVIESDAFLKCTMTKVHLTDLSAWCKIEFDTAASNPLSCGAQIYMDDKLVADVVVPSDVTALKANVFYGLTPNSLTLHSGIKSIAASALTNCTGKLIVDCPLPIATSVDTSVFNKALFTEVVFGDSVTTIGAYSFPNCANLTSVTVNQGVATIEPKAFYGSTKIAFYGDYASADHRCLIKDNTLVAFSSADITEYVIPEGVTAIGDNVFDTAVYITSVTMPEGVTTIGKYAFYNCYALKKVNTPNSLTTIDDYAFYGCQKLSEVPLSANLTKIGTRAFYQCIALTSLNLPDSVTSVGAGAFYGCNKVTTASLGRGITSIPANIFRSCSSLTKVNILGDVTSIGANAFEYCRNMTTINIPSTVTSIGDNAFYNCTALKSVNITDLSAWCKIEFYYDSYGFSNPLRYGADLVLNGEILNDIVIPSGITNIKANAFSHATSITSVTVPEGVTAIDNYAFSNCTNLAKVVLPSTLTKISTDAFLSCASIKEVHISDLSAWCKTSFNLDLDAQPLRNGAALFVNGKELTDFVAPADVTRISDYAFYGCSSIKSVDLPGVTEIEDYAFNSCASLESVTLGKGIRSIGWYAFYSSSSVLTTVYCKAITPPSISSTYSSFAITAGLKIYVPRESYDAYTSSKSWSIYKSYIEPYDFE